MKPTLPTSAVPLVPSFAVRVLDLATGRAVTLVPWNAPPTPLYQFIGGLEDGERGTLRELASYADIGLIVVQWLVVNDRGDLFVATRHGYRSTREVIA